ncbi:MAG: site-specific integrase, partial [Bacteroidales bacterium]|nr:site-specific integrase [Bacteroidales bacterium]
LNSFSEFEKNLSFKKINTKFLREYEAWMLSKNRNKEAKRYTTIAIYMRNLRHILNNAIKERIFNENSYPFGKEKEGKYGIPESRNKKKALSLSEIKELFNYIPDNKSEAMALSYWLFSYLCNGMNMADIANLKYRDIKGNNIVFIRQKTKNTSKEKREIAVYLLPEVKNIIKNIGNKPKEKDSYIFQIYNEQMTDEQKFFRLKQHIQNTNKHIKKIAIKAGLDKEITTYWARHSFSTVLKRSGASIEFISEQLGHTSTKVTTNYLDSFEDEQRAEFAKKLTDF